MTTNQWETLITSLISAATQMVNRYCGVLSFESTEYVEYHSGRGMSGEKGRTYREIDRTFLPRQQPVVSVSKVEVDTGTVDAVPTWSTMVVRSALALLLY